MTDLFCIRCRGRYWPSIQSCKNQCWECATDVCHNPTRIGHRLCWECEDPHYHWTKPAWQRAIQLDPVEWRGEPTLLGGEHE